MRTYSVVLTGKAPLLMHYDNLWARLGVAGQGMARRGVAGPGEDV
jgi:hypothetical protein